MLLMSANGPGRMKYIEAKILKPSLFIKPSKRLSMHVNYQRFINPCKYTYLVKMLTLAYYPLWTFPERNCLLMPPIVFFLYLKLTYPLVWYAISTISGEIEAKHGKHLIWVGISFDAGSHKAAELRYCGSIQTHARNHTSINIDQYMASFLY